MQYPDTSARPADPLAELNAQQREAATHGTGESASDTRPLLVIAGAGSGKTNTLAHRVANLIAHGADPRRIHVFTFSRRAAAEMTRRAERIIASGLANTATIAAWAGTFHAVGARCLCDHAAHIGL